MQDKHPGGRPTKFTAEHKEKLLYAISKGAPYELACNYARIHYTTFLNWKELAETDQKYFEFFEELKHAESATALRWLGKIDEAMDKGTWQSAAWKLERRHSKYFSDQSGVIALNERVDNIEDDKNAQGKRSSERLKSDEENGTSG